MLKDEFDALEHKLIEAVLESHHEIYLSQIQNKEFRRSAVNADRTLEKINSLEQKIKDGTYKLFKPEFHFSEVYDREDQDGNHIGGFDIVIGNPPYGVRIDNEIKDWHELGSRDSYGAFISTTLKRFLKKGGVLEFIVSDTWLTIKTHSLLRQQVLGKQLHKVIRLHQDCFEATVNACIISISNLNEANKQLIAADLTNISTRDNVETLRFYLYDLESHIGEFTNTYAVYAYPQDLININSNYPIFVGSPKLFKFMQDTGVATIQKEIAGKKVPVRQIKMNGKLVELVRFGDIADIKQGLATADNKAYLFQNPEARGSYRNVDEFRDFLLTETDLQKITTNNDRRLKIISKGIHKSKDETNFDEDCWFEGRYIVPYDKGGESNTETGWLPNYYVPTNYYIDWSTWAVNRLKTFTTSAKNGRIASRFQNKEYYFLKGCTFSITGIYAPTFRINNIGVFDVKGSFIKPPLDIRLVLGVLASRFIKYLSKVFIYNCVDMQVDAIKEVPFVMQVNETVVEIVQKIVEKQKINDKYDYGTLEQIEIDELIYDFYGLGLNDISEVEAWYARRYPKLVTQ